MSDDKNQDPATGRFLPGNNANPEGKGGIQNRPEHWFRPGQSGNPGGKTSEQRRQEVRNAERASRIRGRLLAAIERQIGHGEEIEDDEAVTALKCMTPELMRMLTDAENRGLGAPTQHVEIEDKSKTDEQIMRELLEKGVSATEIEAFTGLSVPEHLLNGGPH